MEHLFTDALSFIPNIVSGLDFSSAQAGVTTAEPAYSFGANADSNFLTSNNIWMMLCTGLVFLMHLGFSSVETGFIQSKNTVNVLFKNVLTPMIGLVTYFFWGFNTMYPGDLVNEAGETLWNGWISFGGMAAVPSDYSSMDYAGGGYTYWTDFLFQGMFAATCATIVSGAVAERVKIDIYLIFTFIFVGIVYPILGSWHWGGGWASEAGFYDFAGSTLVHSVGGWGALAGVIVIGPRIGKYVDGKINDFAGASVPLAVIGVFLLWFGWFGFNGGSVLNANPETVSLVLVTTCLGACGGGLFGVLTGSIVFKRLDLGMALNGILAGLVGVTAGADVLTPVNSLIVGAISGVLVVFSAVGLDKLKLDDCVGAISVHLTCGIWGTLAVGIFGFSAATNDAGEFINAAGAIVASADEAANTLTFMTQLIPVLAYGAVAFSAAFILFYVMKITIGVRVTKENELNGLDSHEHGIRGYTILVP